MAHLGELVVTLRLDNQLKGELQSALSNLGRGGGGKPMGGCEEPRKRSTGFLSSARGSRSSRMWWRRPGLPRER